jgi:predicted DNA-binding protein
VGKRKKRQPGEPMTLYIRLESATADRVAERAARLGMTENKWTYSLIEQALSDANDLDEVREALHTLQATLDRLAAALLPSLPFSAPPGNYPEQPERFH